MLKKILTVTVSVVASLLAVNALLESKLNKYRNITQEHYNSVIRGLVEEIEENLTKGRYIAVRKDD